MAKAIQTQLELKTKCEQVQQSLKGLYDWEQEIKQKEAQTRQQQQQEVEGDLAAPVRSCVDEMLKFVADQNAKEKTEMTSSNPPPPPPASSITELKEAEKFNAIGNTFHKRAKDAAMEFSFHKENNDQNAIEMYSKAIEINDRDPTYFVNRANSLFTLERYEECITDCDSAIALDAECANAYYRRMQAYEYLGNNEQAYSDCAKILKVAMDRNQIARTKQDMERIEKRLKKEADIVKEQGNKHWTSKEFEKGRQCFSKAISLYGNDPIYFYNRSLCNFHLKDYDAVAKDCDRAIELDKDYFRPYYQRMRVRELRADYLGAINDCQTYLKLVKNEKQRLTAEKDLERLQLTLKKEQQPKAYNWNELRKNASLVSFVNKAPHLRSKFLFAETAKKNNDLRSVFDGRFQTKCFQLRDCLQLRGHSGRRYRQDLQQQHRRAAGRTQTGTLESRKSLPVVLEQAQAVLFASGDAVKPTQRDVPEGR
uniref:RNA polymerase II-associated protein 3 n=1 Tax=Culex pipiens TaxID=7175 RepID=A0A8D8ARA2_CULPI